VIHPSQIITGEDLSVRWHSIELISSFLPLGVVSGYSLGLQWQTKDTIPVGKTFDETAKISLRGKLDVTVLTDREFQMPSELIWIEIGLLIREMDNGDRWQWNRTGKYLVLNDVQAQQPDGMIQHQYTLLSQGEIVHELVLIPATEIVFWAASFTADVQAMGSFTSVNFVKIL
jgi:hypothetical protein